jgi:hypothetical protein
MKAHEFNKNSGVAPQPQRVKPVATSKPSVSKPQPAPRKNTQPSVPVVEQTPPVVDEAEVFPGGVRAPAGHSIHRAREANNNIWHRIQNWD